MRKYIIFLILALIPIVSNAKMTEWKEVQSILVPVNTPLYYKFTEKGNVKYFLKLEHIGNVTVSKSNAEKFLAGEIQLELVKWQNKIEPTKFKYTVRQYKPSQSNIDLRDVFGVVQKDDFGQGLEKCYNLLIK